MLRLRNEIRGDVHRVGSCIGKDGDLGGAGFGVDSHDSAHEPLGGSDVDISRPGDDVDPRAAFGAVGEHRNGLGATHGVDLVDAEQGAGTEHDRVRQGGVTLRRRRDGERLDPRHLRRNDVHHHTARISDAAAGHVEPRPA